MIANGDRRRGRSDLGTIGYYAIVATAGHDTTSSTLAGGFEALIRHPEQLARAAARARRGIDNAVEEMIRWVTPVRHFLRHAQEDYVLRGVQLAQGRRAAHVVPVGEPRRGRVRRPVRASTSTRDERVEHLAFGTGVHFCLGALSRAWSCARSSASSCRGSSRSSSPGRPRTPRRPSSARRSACRSATAAVAHALQAERVRRRGRSGARAVARREHRRDVCRGPAPLPHLDQGPGDVAHHVAEEAAALGDQHDLVAARRDLEPVEAAARLVVLGHAARRAAERAEVVRAEQRLGALGHRRDVERPAQVQAEARAQRARLGPVQDPVRVGLRERVAARVEVGRDREPARAPPRRAAAPRSARAAGRPARAGSRSRRARPGRARARRRRCGPRGTRAASRG